MVHIVCMRLLSPSHFKFINILTRCYKNTLGQWNKKFAGKNLESEIMIVTKLTVLNIIYILTPAAHGRAVVGKDGASLVVDTQETTGSVSGFVNSTAQGNGEPNSAVAHAWQGGQTSAYGSQSATSESGNSNAQTTGSSTCQQGYSGSAGGPNSTSANSIGNALCNATYADSGTMTAQSGQQRIGGRVPGFQPPARPALQISSPQTISINNTVGQIGEGISGQYHSSQSSAGNGALNVQAGGFTNTPQSGLNVQHSLIDQFGAPVVAVQDFYTDQGVDSLEQTVIDTSGGSMNHASGGMSSIYGMGNMEIDSYNSHAPEEDEGEIEAGKKKPLS